jgi:hypothetical protein
MRNKKTIKNTMNSQVYKMAIKSNLGCPICPPNKGCNRYKNTDLKSWKNYRGNQWKE